MAIEAWRRETNLRWKMERGNDRRLLEMRIWRLVASLFSRCEVEMLFHTLAALSQIRPRPAFLFVCPVTFVESMEENLSIDSLGRF